MQDSNLDEEINFDLICRTCLNSTNEIGSVFITQPEFGMSIAEMLMTFTKLKIQSKDNLPKRICHNCLGAIRVAYKFTKLSEHSEQFLLNYLRKKSVGDSSNESTAKDIKLEPSVEIFIKEEIIETHNNDDDDGHNYDVEFEEKLKIVNDNTADDKKDEDLVSTNTKKKKRSPNKNSKAKTAEDEKPIVCEVCKKIFKTRSSLNRHSILHIGERKKFECRICFSKFSLVANVRRHMKKFHDETRKMDRNKKKVCEVCGVPVASMLVHMRLHTGERPYKCDTCGRGFSQKCDLTVHKRVHTGEKPYLCNMCGKGFHKSYNLKNHVRTHTGERPNKCTYCEEAFIYPKDLKVHLLMHMGKKPFECADCGLGFKGKNALTTHCKSKGHTKLEKAP